MHHNNRQAGGLDSHAPTHPTDPNPPELVAVLERIASALEKQNEQMTDLIYSTTGIANRIEDLGALR